MQRKLLIVICLLFPAFISLAQKPEKAKEKRALLATDEKVNYKEKGTELPPINFYRRDGIYITNKDLKPDQPLIIMLFNPTCEHCEEQTVIFGKELDFSKNQLILMAAPAMGPYLQNFVHNTQADKYPAIQIGLDSADYINQTFLYQTLPQINVYNKQKKLVKIFSGKVSMEKLKEYLR